MSLPNDHERRAGEHDRVHVIRMKIALRTGVGFEWSRQQANRMSQTSHSHTVTQSHSHWQEICKYINFHCLWATPSRNRPPAQSAVVAGAWAGEEVGAEAGVGAGHGEVEGEGRAACVSEFRSSVR